MAHTTIQAATKALVGIIAALREGERPAQLGFVSLVLRDYDDADGSPAPIVATLFFRWRHDASPEEIDEPAPVRGHASRRGLHELPLMLHSDLEYGNPWTAGSITPR